MLMQQERGKRRPRNDLADFLCIPFNFRFAFLVMNKLGVSLSSVQLKNRVLFFCMLAAATNQIMYPVCLSFRICYSFHFRQVTVKFQSNL